MEKKDIKVSYANSGVNTLSGIGTCFMIIGSIAIIVAVAGFGMFYSGDSDNAVIAVTSLFVSLGSFLGGAICMGLAGIARTALYQRMILEQEYLFIKE
jgi:hypothetical protein